MKKLLLLALLLIAFGAVVQAESPSPLMKLPLIDSVKLGDFDIHKNNESRSFTLPKFQARPGYIPVLRCRMGTFKTTFGGCCFAAKINISGAPLPIMEQLGVELVNLFASVLTTESTCCHHNLHALCKGNREVRGLMTRENVNGCGGNNIRKILARIEATTNLC